MKWIVLALILGLFGYGVYRLNKWSTDPKYKVVKTKPIAPPPPTVPVKPTRYYVAMFVLKTKTDNRFFTEESMSYGMEYFTVTNGGYATRKEIVDLIIKDAKTESPKDKIIPKDVVFIVTEFKDSLEWRQVNRAYNDTTNTH